MLLLYAFGSTKMSAEHAIQIQKIDFIFVCVNICVHIHTLLTALLCRICYLKGLKLPTNRVEILGLVLSYAQRGR